MPRARSSNNLVTLFYKVKKLESAVSFLQEHGVLHKSVNCTKCLREVDDIDQETGTGHFFFRCRSCNKKVSVRDNTLLSQGNIGIRTFILLTYLFIMLQGLSVAQKVHEAFVDEEDSDDLLSPGTRDTRQLETTFVKYHEIFRDMISQHMINENSGDHMVGGPGCSVEVDVALYGQRDYHRGLIGERRRLWVLGGIVRESGEMFFEICKDNRCDDETLEEIILRRVRPGTRVITNCLDGYDRLKEKGTSLSTCGESLSGGQVAISSSPS